jgi:Zn-dependent oligopeptidase
LDEETRNEVKRIKMKISELGTKFGSNLNEENTILEFAVDELTGVPQDLVDSFEKVSNYF